MLSKLQRNMRILLIAYDFPPIPSPQSLRWAYLVRELSALGNEVHVIAPDHSGYGPSGGLPVIPRGVVVHRTYPGPFAWLLGSLVRVKRRPARSRPGNDAVGAEPVGEAQLAAAPMTLNWKGRLVGRVKTAYAAMLYPDLRAEWNICARRTLFALLRDLRPDVVIASHEPASVLVLGLAAKRSGHFVVADLGDPVCAPYTPRRWRRRALSLENRVCSSCDLVLVTSSATRDLLRKRHSLGSDRIHLLPQGFDAKFKEDCEEPQELLRPDILELLYTGSFYDFRGSDAILAAVAATPGVRLSIASSRIPDTVEEVARNYPEKVRLLGFLPHSMVLTLQRRADVLVNLANADPAQVPGKVYEYLGARRPILHVGENASDEAAELIRAAGVGWTCRDSVPAITELLDALSTQIDKVRASGSPDNPDLVGKYAWSALARDLVDRIHAFPSTAQFEEEHGAY